MAAECRGWQRDARNDHWPCGKPATGDDGWCDTHRYVARVDPYGSEANQKHWIKTGSFERKAVNADEA
tara:strand:+ start:69 stop:272 length:204 start_codon:yes stop_codon:yes gene_type:complete